MNERTEQIKAAMSDEAFVNACIEAENEEAVQKLFADKGIEMSLTEIELMGEMIGALADGTLTGEQLDKLANGGELSEEELEAAAGGVLTPTGPVPKPLHSGDVLPADVYRVSGAASSSSVGRIIGGIAVGIAAVATIGYGVYKYKDDIASGAKWVADKITSRW
ncbi:MAG: hypothetical protein IKN55_11150 [Oscillospiraceae bacterium]|nr:hypothetical protein [Oscillospiraceae bacterium]